MSAVVMEFRPKDRIRQDVEPIALIYRSMGTQAAEEVVNRALTELAMTMSALAAQVRGKNLLDVARQLRRLERMAQQLGLADHSDRCHTCPVFDRCDYRLDIATDEALRELYLEAEGDDGYFRDRCVFADDITIEEPRR